MTRWARSGNTQRHRKPPQDATPWEEFTAVRNENKRKRITVGSEETKDEIRNSDSIAVESSSHSDAKVAEIASTENDSSKNEDFSSTKSLKKKRKDKFKSNEEQDSSVEHVPKVAEIASTENDSSKNEDFSSTKSLKKKRKDKFKSNEEQDSSVEHVPKVAEIASTENDSSKNEDFSSTKSLKKKRKDKFKSNEEQDSPVKDVPTECELRSSKKKRKKCKKNVKDLSQNEPPQAHDPEELDTSLVVTACSEGDSCEQESKPSENVELEPFKKRHNPNKKDGKERFLEKVRKNRLNNGITLLPQEVEDKLYKMKRNFRKKGLPGEIIKQLVRKARRKEELSLRKTMKTCFNCRKFGHILSQCPEIKADCEQGTGVCFKCGSTEHTSYRCHLKISGFPFAKCFICHEQGHLSRNCPKNDHGVYIKGGKCNLCGEIDHLKKDCPVLQKAKSKEEEITVDTLTTTTNVDDEVVSDFKPFSDTKKSKKQKVVKF